MKRLAINAAVLFALLGTSAAHGQTYQTPPLFKHIVVIVQENRTPDNLFGANPGVIRRCGSEDSFEAGVDIDNGGPSNFTGTTICSQQVPSFVLGGGDHTHSPDWETQCDYNTTAGICNMDGACYTGSKPACTGTGPAPYPPYTYVGRSGNTGAQPYFDIATNYGFANYMFQTNEGPSYPAHQFIFGGTTAPTFPGDSHGYYKYFVSENPAKPSGCQASPTIFPNWANPLGGGDISDPRGTSANECYDRDTLFTYKDSNNIVHDKGVSWMYYAQIPGVIWDAPESDPQTCYFAVSGSGNCTSTYFKQHVTIESQSNGYSSAPILDDIQNCKLQQVTFVTPDEAWSDHPGTGDQSLGPSWVAAILDAIGNSSTQSKGGGVCDYWGTSTTHGISVEPTAIFITWDDWGGFYDHVPPPVVYTGTGSLGNWTCSAPNAWGCGYVYGFRVPLLVASEYTSAGTISDPITSTVTYPPPAEWTHDFGSILKFIEENFSAQGLGPIAPSPYTYADQNSLDTNNGTYVPLWEFFLASQPRAFTNISPQNSQYNVSYFQNYYNNTNSTPTGPDEGADDN